MYKKLFALVLGIEILANTLGYAGRFGETEADRVHFIRKTRLPNPPAICRTEDFRTRALQHDQAHKERKGACGQKAGEEQIDAITSRFNDIMSHNLQYNKKRNGIDDARSFTHNAVKYFFSIEYKADTANLSQAQHTLAWQYEAAERALRQGNIDRQTYKEFVDALATNRVIRLVVRTSLESNSFIQSHGVILSRDRAAYPEQIAAYCTTMHPYFKELYDQSLSSPQMRKKFADLNAQCAALPSQQITLSARAPNPNPFVAGPVRKAAPPLRYTRANLGSFLNHLEQDYYFTQIAEAVEDSEVSANVLRNLARDSSYGTTERTAGKYENLWKNLKKKFPTKYSEWKNSTR